MLVSGKPPTAACYGAVVTAIHQGRVSIIILLLASACSPSPPSALPVHSASTVDAPAPAAIDQDVCSFLAADAVEAIIGQRISDAEAHISATPLAQVRDCVYFARDRGLVTLSVRQEATSAEAVEGVLNALRADYPPGTSGSQSNFGGVLGLNQVSGTAFAYCWGADNCQTSLAFSVPPQFFVINVRRDVGNLKTAQAIANVVLENLAP